jgi:hypothetical protein
MMRAGIASGKSEHANFYIRPGVVLVEARICRVLFPVAGNILRRKLV